MSKDLMTMYNELCDKEIKFQAMREKWIKAVESDPYYADELEPKLRGALEKLVDTYGDALGFDADYETMSMVWSK